MEKERLVAFTDAVLAIIMTVLVLELQKPDSPTLEAFWALRANFFAYFLSFFWLASMWMTLHTIWLDVKTINTKILWSVIVLLFCVSFFPYATSIVSTHFNNIVTQGFYGIIVVSSTVCSIITNRFLIEENKDNSTFVSTVKQYNKILFIDVCIKLIGFIISITLYPPMMMYSVLFTALFMNVMKIFGVIFE